MNFKIIVTVLLIVIAALSLALNNKKEITNTKKFLYYEGRKLEVRFVDKDSYGVDTLSMAKEEYAKKERVKTTKIHLVYE